jgi:hypothetical protein
VACDAARVVMRHDQAGNVLDVGRKTRTIPTPLKRALKERDHGCRFPGCTNTRFVDGHHIQHWADGGRTSLDNLVLLCGRHHRALHEGGFRIARAPDGLVFLDPHGSPVPAVPAPPEVDRLSLPPTTTEMRTWNGDPMQYGYILEGLLP